MTQKQANLPSSMEVASAALAERCYSDPEFAKRLRAHPREAIKEACGTELPESLTIKVHENDGRTWHLPVPHGQATDALSDKQLAAISGGEIWIAALVIGTVAATVAVGAGGVSGIAIAAGNS